MGVPRNPALVQRTELANRLRLERELALRVARALGVQEEQLFELLGDPPNLANVPPEFWQEAERNMRLAVGGMLQSVYQERAFDLMEAQSVGVDPAIMNDMAAQWARQYAGEFATGINRTTRNAIASQVAAFFEEGLTMGELRDRIARSPAHVFDRVRADRIAGTEVTRAAVEGELAMADMLRSQGVPLVAVWVTARDEDTCPICRPLNGVRAIPNTRPPMFEHPKMGRLPPPPAHVLCRCLVMHIIVR